MQKLETEIPQRRAIMVNDNNNTEQRIAFSFPIKYYIDDWHSGAKY